MTMRTSPASDDAQSYSSAWLPVGDILQGDWEEIPGSSRLRSSHAVSDFPAELDALHPRP